MKPLLNMALDAADRLMIEKYADSLPYFRRLISGGTRLPLRSVFLLFWHRMSSLPYGAQPGPARRSRIHRCAE